MKKLITILSSFGLVITTGTTAVACKNNQPSSLKPTEDGNTSLTSNPENNGSENTDSIQNKERIEKIKGQLVQLEGAEQKATKLLGEITEGNKKVEGVSEEQRKKFKNYLDSLNTQKTNVEETLKTIKSSKEKLQEELKSLESKNN
ncbi:lipoprotein [Mycoplasma mycoides]|uniref:lipoprotein n=1 Tax=Mycoplasma mycoides TaxID=2102 RepID=UPI0022409901|nr:lipoprotein [Mycoplasma mycoides]QVK02468.1 lipoprotein [Mycoplasma mycoides subsp. capri]QVK03284.1 lipoprotein [Mycoplasma mycoides subsp. capri]